MKAHVPIATLLILASLIACGGAFLISPRVQPLQVIFSFRSGIRQLQGDGHPHYYSGAGCSTSVLQYKDNRESRIDLLETAVETKGVVDNKVDLKVRRHPPITRQYFVHTALLTNKPADG